MDKKTIDNMKSELIEIKKRMAYNFKCGDIILGEIEYSNEDIDELIEHYTEIEEYKLCEKLQKYKK